MRAREWVPEMGGFASVDELAFLSCAHHAVGAEPQRVRFADPTGPGAQEVQRGLFGLLRRV